MPFIPEKEFNLLKKSFQETYGELQVRTVIFGNTLKYYTIQLLLII